MTPPFDPKSLNTHGERERSLYLLQRLKHRGINMDGFLLEGYEAVIVHSSSTLVCANQAMIDMLGYGAEELLGMNAWSLFPARSAPIVAEKLKQRSEEPYQVYVRRKDGSEFLAELKGINFDIAGESARAILARELNPD